MFCQPSASAEKASSSVCADRLLDCVHVYIYITRLGYVINTFAFLLIIALYPCTFVSVREDWDWFYWLCAATFLRGEREKRSDEEKRKNGRTIEFAEREGRNIVDEWRGWRGVIQGVLYHRGGLEKVE